MNNNEGFLGLRSCADARVAGLIGLLAGDALGVSFEFKTPNLLPPREQIEMQPPSGFRKSHAGVPVGTWSDDGAQALCLLASLADCGQFSLTDFADRLVRWLNDGYMAVDGEVFDCGVQTAVAIDRLRDGVSPHASGGALERDNGNGSLMRVLPLALWHVGPDEALVRDAHLQSLPTHAHSRSLVACSFYCLVARGYLATMTEPWAWADQRLEEIYRLWSDEGERTGLLAELDVLRRFPKTNEPRGSGYCIDSLWSARMAMGEETFEDVVRTAILFGHDTDTTAAIAGGWAGLRHGVEGIPIRWLAHLRGFEIVQPLIRGLKVA
jgi:ADP-ribosyl-[dinitrogen reductase] hydrolase